MAMDSLKKEDLVGRSLERLLDEIESKAQDDSVKSYEDLEKFVIKLANIAANATLKVDTKTGEKKLDVRGTDIDLTDAIKQIVGKINTGIDGNSATSAAAKARASLRDTIGSTVGVLLKEDEIMKKLATKDLDAAQFEAFSKEEIKRSQDKVKVLEARKKSCDNALGMFGKDVNYNKKWHEKSLISQVRDDKSALEKMKEVQRKLYKISELQKAATTMDSSSTDYANNMRDIDILKKDIKATGEDLKRMGLQTAARRTAGKNKAIDVEFLVRIESGDIEDAIEASSKITGFDYDGVANSFGPTALTLTDKTLQDVISDDYKAIADVICSDNNKAIAFGFTNKTEAKNELFDAVSGEAKQDAIEARLKKVKDAQKEAENEIKFEKNYQKRTEESAKLFKAKFDREAELKAKFEEVAKEVPYKQEKDTSGKLVFNPDGSEKWEQAKNDDGSPKVDDAGNPVYEIEKDADGNPVKHKQMRQELNPDGSLAYNPDGTPKLSEIKVHKPTDKAMKDYITAAGKDEAKVIKDARDQAKAEVEAEAQALTAEEKKKFIRATYRAQGGIHPFKFFRSVFFADKMFKDGYEGKYLKDNTTPRQDEAEAQAKVGLKTLAVTEATKEWVEVKNVSEDLGVFREVYMEELVGAASQSKITSELFDGKTEDHVEVGADRAAKMSAVEAADILIALQEKREGKIDDAEYERRVKDYKAAIKKGAVDRQDRAHADKVIAPTTGRNSNTPIFEDDAR